MNGKLYLIPNSLGSDNIENFIPSGVLRILKKIDHFIVENERNARRFLIKCGYEKPVDDIRFSLLNKYTMMNEIAGFLLPCIKGIDIGVITEAGVPGVADPGAEVVKIAHEKGIQVVPLTGPSSVLLALMASGMNGQNFSFTGYLPIKSHERKKKIKELETESQKTGITHIFIETPYRNNSLFQSLLSYCHGDTKLCIACDITLDTEYIKTQDIKKWKKEKVDLNKRPCIFLIS